jgi:hypothetical protein
VIRKIPILLCLISVNYAVYSQLSIRVETGFSYIEHFSTGIALSISEKHNLSLLYGSNLFIRPCDFSNILLQYERRLVNMNIAGITPGIGIKGGYSVYTNKYYKWYLFQIIPIVRLDYRIHERAFIFLDAGIAISIEHSMERISYGEIGMYRKYLPELKFGLNFKL